MRGTPHQMRKRARRNFDRLHERQRGLCAECRRRMVRHFKGKYHPRMPTIDHKKRLADGGTNHIDNLELVCVECNHKRDRVALGIPAVRTCRHCGKPLNNGGGRRGCPACRQAFCYLFAGVGLS